MLPLISLLMSDAMSWVVGGAIGVVMFTAVIIYCIKIGYLSDPRKDLRILWSWVIFVGADLLCLVMIIINLCKVL